MPVGPDAAWCTAALVAEIRRLTVYSINRTGTMRRSAPGRAAGTPVGAMPMAMRWSGLALAGPGSVPVYGVRRIGYGVDLLTVIVCAFIHHCPAVPLGLGGAVRGGAPGRYGSGAGEQRQRVYGQCTARVHGS